MGRLANKWLSLAAGVMLLVPSPALWARSYRGVALPPSARKVEPGRFRCPRSFERTVRFYQRWIRKKHGWWARGADTPRVRSYHFFSGSASTWWDVINVSQIHGVTYVFLVPRMAR